MKSNNNLVVVGWREWLSLPELGIHRIKAKIDTGARTSALHAFELKVSKSRGKQKLHFVIHPLQHNTQKTLSCVAEIKDIRWVTDSGGHKEKRYVIETPVTIGQFTWPIEITLTNRDIMKFRMLLGRTALSGRFVVNPMRSFIYGRL